MEPNENKHFRGLHLVVWDPDSQKPLFSKVFDTYKTSDGLEKFLFENTIKSGEIVILACKDDCAQNLSEPVKKWFSDELGSKEIMKIGYREAFALISIKGSKFAYEKRSPEKKN